MPESDKTQSAKSEQARSEQEWKRELSTNQYKVLREHATEYPGTSPLNDEKRNGVYS